MRTMVYSWTWKLEILLQLCNVCGKFNIQQQNTYALQWNLKIWNATCDYAKFAENFMCNFKKLLCKWVSQWSEQLHETRTWLSWHSVADTNVGSVFYPFLRLIQIIQIKSGLWLHEYSNENIKTRAEPWQRQSLQKKMSYHLSSAECRTT